MTIDLALLDRVTQKVVQTPTGTVLRAYDGATVLNEIALSSDKLPGEINDIMQMQRTAIAHGIDSFVGSKVNPITGSVELSAAGVDALHSANTAVSGQNGRPYPSFTDASGEWTKYAVGTGTATEVSDPEYGRTLRITAGVAGAKYGIGRDMVIDAKSPIAFSFLAKRDANLSVLDVEIGYAQFGFTKMTKLNKGVSFLGAGEWQRIVFSLGEYETITGAPTAADMQDVRTIRFSITPTGGNTTVLDITDFRVHRATPGGVVGIFFDDGRLDTYTISYQEMRARNMVGAIAIEYQAVGNVDRCSQGMLNEMYAAGWDMCAHHTVGFTTLQDSEQVTHHRAMRDYLSANNFDRANHIFAYPGGLRNASTDKIARGYWQVSRAVSSMTVQGCAGAFDPVRPPHAYINSSTTLANAKGRIDRAKAYGGSIVFIFHSIVESGATAENWLRSDFVALLDYIASQGLPVVPISDIWTKQPRFTAF